MGSGGKRASVRQGRGKVTAETSGADYGAGGAACGSTCQFTGHQRGFPLGQVLGGGNVVPCDLRLLWCSCWQLFVHDLRFSHVVVARVKVFLLQRGGKISLNHTDTKKKEKLILKQSFKRQN